MTTTPSLIYRIQELAGPDVAAAIAAEFGGRTYYMSPPKEHRVPPKFRISGTFRDDDVPLRDSVAAVGSAIVSMKFSASDLMVEIDPKGLGHAVLERLQDALPGVGIKVIAMQGAQA